MLSRKALLAQRRKLASVRSFWHSRSVVRENRWAHTFPSVRAPSARGSRKGFKQPFLLQVASYDDDESETTPEPRSGFPMWFGSQYKGWISYEQRPPSGKMTHFFPIRGLSFLLLPAISFLSARCASRGNSHISGYLLAWFETLEVGQRLSYLFQTPAGKTHRFLQKKGLQHLSPFTMLFILERIAKNERGE